MFPITFKFPKRFFRLFKKLIQAVENLNPISDLPKIEGGDMSLVFDLIGITMQGANAMATFTIPDDQPDFEVSISPLGNLKDSEGNAVAVQESFTTSNPDVISVTFPNGSGDLSKILCHVGNPGVASLDYVATAKIGRKATPVKVSDATCIVTTGNIDLGTLTGGDVQIPSLEADPADEPPVTPAAVRRRN